MEKLTVCYELGFDKDGKITYEEKVFVFESREKMKQMQAYVDGYQDAKEDYSSMEAWDNVDKYGGILVSDSIKSRLGTTKRT